MSNSPPPSGSGSVAVLVVEDDAMMRLLVRRTLAAAGYAVWTAASVPEARLLLPSIQDRLSLVLADVVMPGGLGPELAADVLAADLRARVAYMSIYPQAKLKAHGVDLQGAKLLTKPFMPAELLTFVGDLVGKGPSAPRE
jgi:two-component system, cell cycle sensor histidine kinase and response regulator CckA